MRAFQNHVRHARRGVVLLVVLALLTLFAVVALMFVFYAEQELVASRYFKESQVGNRRERDPDPLFRQILGCLLCGTDNPESALRWNDLLSNMYGVSPDGNVPFNGLGRRAHWLDLDGNGPGMGIRTDTAVGLGKLPQPFDEASFGAFNPPYTYPDHNIPILGAVGDDNPNDGYPTVVLERSFVRPVKIRDVHGNEVDFDPYDPFDPDYQNFWNVVPNTNQLLPLSHHNANPTADERRLLVARPGIWDGFPAPADRGGDVRNLPPGWVVKIKDDPNTGQPVYHDGNDSYWVDVGLPMQTDRFGRTYKPLAAVFVMDLGGMLNVNAHGNVLVGRNLAHASHQGFGPWEVSFAPLLPYVDPVTGRPEYSQLLLGSLNPRMSGRYGDPGSSSPRRMLPGTDPVPLSTPWVPPIVPPYYSALNRDATIRDLVMNAFIPPGQPLIPSGAGNIGNQIRRTFDFAQSRGYETRWRADFEIEDHPAHFNPFRPEDDDRLFRPADVEALLRHGDRDVTADQSDLEKLLQQNLKNPTLAAKIRRLLTTHSFDVVRPGVTPWWPGPSGYSLLANSRAPSGPALATPATPPGGGEFLPGTWRANVFDWPRVDLNRPLPDYPPLDANGRITDLDAFQVAVQARQELAQAIHNVLRFAVGLDPNAIGSPAERDADRWLAQLAVNIVDLRDNDDYITAYNWDTGNQGNVQEGWVYGFELPRVVINEVYGQYVNIDSDPNANPKDYRVYLWAELYNPLQADSSLRYGGSERLFLPETAPGANDAIQTYRLAILTHQGGNNLRNRNNTPGHWQNNEFQQYTGSSGQVNRCEVPFDTAPNNAEIRPGGANYHGVVVQGMKTVTDPNTGNNEDRIVPDFTKAWQYGWYMVGPNLVDPANPGSGIKRFPVSRDALGNDREADPDRPEPLYRHDGMSYELRDLPDPQKPDDQNRRPTLVLQRLMCPNLPYQPDPRLPNYNNYVTVDYVQNIVLHDGGKPGEAYNAENTFSIGKRQPYASFHEPANDDRAYAANSQYIPQYPPVFPPKQYPPLFPTQNARNQPRHTFYRHNALEELYYNETLPAGNLLNFGDGTNPPINRINPSRTLDLDNDGNPDVTQTLKSPFDWLAHFDREFVSTIDLVQASGLKPFEVLQDFVLNVGGQFQPHQHLVPWESNDSRLYRAWEYLDTRSRIAGASTWTLQLGEDDLVPPDGWVRKGWRWVSLHSRDGNPDNGILGVFNHNGTDYLWGRADNGGIWVIRAGSTLTLFGIQPPSNPQDLWVDGNVIRVDRVDPITRRIYAYFPYDYQVGTWVSVPYMSGRVPGKININAVNDLEPFAALFDPGPGNFFTAGDVVQMYNSMIQSRNRNPFRSLAIGHVPNPDYQYEIGAGVQDTLLRWNDVTNGGLLFVPPSAVANNAHPWVKAEALNKIFNNVTVRSNCFAVWITIGYFEMTWDSQQGKWRFNNGRQMVDEHEREIRHKFFAIVDRSVFDTWMLDAWVRSKTFPGLPAPNVGLLRTHIENLDLREDQVLDLNPNISLPNDADRVRLPAPVVYWSRIQ